MSELNPTNMTAKVMMITPEIAKDFKSRSAGNRSLRQGRLAVMCRDRRENRFPLTHQPIAIGTDDRMYDGHHRCEMVIITEMPTPFLVVRNVDPLSASYIDCGLPRSAKDAFQMAGIGNYTNDLISTANCFTDMPFGAHNAFNRKKSRMELLDIIDMFSEGIEFACRTMKGIDGASKSSRCLIARAWYHIDRLRLEEFTQVMRTGLPISKVIDQDQAAIAYARLLCSTKSVSGWGTERERYWKGQSCLNAFAHRYALGSIRSTEEDLYPVPERVTK